MNQRPLSDDFKTALATFDRGTKTTVLGMSRCGKSSIGRECARIYPRKIFIDILGEPEYESYPSVDNIPDFIKALKFYKTHTEFKLVYRMSDTHGKDHNMEVLNKICELVWHFGNVLLFIDECDSYCTVGKIPHWWHWLLRRGRHHNISLIHLTQTPCDLNKQVLKQSDHKFFGLFSENNDIDWCSRVGLWTREDLLQLKKYWFIHDFDRNWKVITAFK